jgi:hypothetical protein
VTDGGETGGVDTEGTEAEYVETEEEGVGGT